MISQELAPYGKRVAVTGYAFFLAAHFFINAAEIVETRGNFEAFRAALLFPELFCLEAESFGPIQTAGFVFGKGQGKN